MASLSPPFLSTDLTTSSIGSHRDSYSPLVVGLLGRITTCGPQRFTLSQAATSFTSLLQQSMVDTQSGWQYLPAAAPGAPMRTWEVPSSTTMRIAWLVQLTSTFSSTQ